MKLSCLILSCGPCNSKQKELCGQLRSLNLEERRGEEKGEKGRNPKTASLYCNRCSGVVSKLSLSIILIAKNQNNWNNGSIIETAFGQQVNLNDARLLTRQYHKTKSNGNSMLSRSRMDFGFIWVQIVTVALPGSVTLAKILTTLQLLLYSYFVIKMVQ